MNLEARVFYNEKRSVAAFCFDSLFWDILPNHVPTLHICSTEDQLIPAQSTQRVYKAQKDAGHPHTHLLTLENGGRHAQLVYGQHGEKLGNVMHAFLHRYGFPADQKRAFDGMPAFESECSPRPEDFEEKDESCLSSLRNH